MKNIKFLAYYLPQFHPTEENDTWWGKGFTEWTNVTKAKKLFPRHKQPKLPADLGFYDLRVPDIMEEQARLATTHGVDGFVFYHYWFGDQKVLLDKPLLQFLSNDKIQCTFCICWANESWKGTWHGAGNRMLIEQKYGDEQSYIEHFNYLLPFFRDSRRLMIDGKIVFQIYFPESIPNLKLFVDVFRKQAELSGLPQLYFIAVRTINNWDYKSNGFDGYVLYNMQNINKFHSHSLDALFLRYLINNPVFRKITQWPILIYYKTVRKCLEDIPSLNHNDFYPLAMPNWDNTPRVKNSGTVFLNESPERFEEHLDSLVKKISNRDSDRQILFIKSWNEWAEGNILEPDMKYGHAFLKAVSNAKKKYYK